VDKWGVGCG